jgi:hypothetical protein
MGNDTSLPLTPIDISRTKEDKEDEDINDDDSSEPSVLLCSIDECFVYRIPPRPSAAGYKAQDWPGGLDNPYKTGFLRVTGRGTEGFLCVWLKNTSTDNKKVIPKKASLDATTAPAAQGNSLLLQCRIPLLDERGYSFWVEPVLDSSRYFVLRLEKGNSIQYIGIGFRERTSAFELKDCIQNYISQLRRQSLISNKEDGKNTGNGNDEISNVLSNVMNNSQSEIQPAKELIVPRSIDLLPKAPLLRPPGQKSNMSPVKQVPVQVPQDKDMPSAVTMATNDDEFGDFEKAV